MAKFCKKIFNLFVAFMVVKTTVLISRFQRKNRFVKRPYIAWDIDEKLFSTGGLVWLTKSQNIFEDILGQVGSFFKPIFALKPWDWDNRFEYHKSHKPIEIYFTKFGRVPLKWL